MQSLVGTLSWGEYSCQAELIDRPNFVIPNDEVEQKGFWLPLTFITTEPCHSAAEHFSFTHTKITRQEATTTSWFGGKSTAEALFTGTETFNLNGKIIHRNNFKEKFLITIWINNLQYKHQ